MLETKLDPKEEREYDQLRRLGQKLHVPIPEHFITLEVFDKNGELIQRHHQRSHSWVRNAYNTMFSTMAMKNATDGAFGAGLLNIKDMAAGIQSGARGIGVSNQDLDSTGNGYRATATNDDYGILVGSGSNAESFEDFALQTQIAEGAAPGELNHIQSEAPAVSYGALVLTCTLIRYLNNNSGGNVAVEEVALACNAWCPTAVTKWMQSRDHLAAIVTVPDTGQLKVTYTISLTYPS